MAGQLVSTHIGQMICTDARPMWSQIRGLSNRPSRYEATLSPGRRYSVALPHPQEVSTIDSFFPTFLSTRNASRVCATCGVYPSSHPPPDSQTIRSGTQECQLPASFIQTIGMHAHLLLLESLLQVVEYDPRNVPVMGIVATP
jgi:hypothetical protein